jgi:hypothetical protein
MFTTLRQLFPDHMRQLKEAKARFEEGCVAYDRAAKAGDSIGAQSLLVALWDTQASLEHQASTLGLAIASYLETEEEIT